MIRFAVFLIVGVLAFAAPASADPAFQQWLAAQWPAAQALGVARTTFDAATRGLEPDLSLPALAIAGKPAKQPQQPEFVQVPSQYLRAASSFPHNIVTRSPASSARSACRATWCWRSGRARPTTAATSCRSTPSARW